jgi:hypothetical protein
MSSYASSDHEGRLIDYLYLVLQLILPIMQFECCMPYSGDDHLHWWAIPRMEMPVKRG